MGFHRHRTMWLWRNPDNVTHRQLLSIDQVWRRSTALTWSRWGCRRLADNIWLLAHDNNNNTKSRNLHICTYWQWPCFSRGQQSVCHDADSPDTSRRESQEHPASVCISRHSYTKHSLNMKNHHLSNTKRYTSAVMWSRYHALELETSRPQMCCVVHGLGWRQCFI